MSDIHTTMPPSTAPGEHNRNTAESATHHEPSPPLVDQTKPPLMDQAKQQAQKVVEQTQHKAGEVLDKATHQTKSWADDQKSAVARELGDVALAVMQTGEMLRGKGTDTYGKYADLTDQAAQIVDNASGYLRDTSVDEMVSQVERLGKQQPVMFLVGAAALGFLAARFLKSSGRGSATGVGGYNPDRQLPVPIDAHVGGVKPNYGTTRNVR